MEAPTSIPSNSMRIVQIENEGNTYICKLQVSNNSIEANIFLADSSMFKGNINFDQIIAQIKGFSDLNINEIFEEIDSLDSSCFSISKDSDKYILKIKIKVFRKDKYLLIDLKENKNMNLTNGDLINYYENIIKSKDRMIFKLNEIIKNKDEEIKILKEQLKNNKYYNFENKDEKEKKLDKNDKIPKEDLYKDFDIKLKNPIHKLKAHTSCVYCLTVMNDGRLVSGSNDHSIIIYNKTTYQPDIIIKEHSSSVCCLTQLSSGVLASCSSDYTIKLFNIKGVEYEIIQTLNYHSNVVYKIVELKNKSLASCSADSSILFYFKDNNEYQKDYKISTNGSCSSIIQTKDNEICYSEVTNNTICFFDLLGRKIKTSISNISKYNGCREWFIMISKDLLLIPGASKISIVNVNHYNIARIIDVPGASTITGVCLISKNILLTGDYAEIIRQWRIEGDNLILIYQKEKTHDGDINCLLNIGNGYIASGSDDSSIKIW